MKYIDDYVAANAQAEVKGKWVIARPMNYTCRTLFERVKEAWAVFTGRAEAVIFHGDDK